MRILGLRIYNFRGVTTATLIFKERSAFIGPNGVGKSTIVDALSLVLGRSRMVQNLTEHDFYGSVPVAADRIRIVATLGGFSTNEPDDHGDWFRRDRGVPKWWDSASLRALDNPAADAELCVEVGFCARFDSEELAVETMRYFHDDDALVDPYVDEGVNLAPTRLLNELGFYVLPARRTWDGVASFGSDLFRRAVSAAGGIPATSVLAHRDQLRAPVSPLEADPAMQALVAAMNQRLGALMGGATDFKLRVTATDSESLLKALVPHYQKAGTPTLPAHRHGTGLVSLQSLVLLLETGVARRAAGKPFILALEEPELHIGPGLQRRLIEDAVALSNQVIVTTHSPEVGSVFRAEDIQVLSTLAGVMTGRSLLQTARNATPNAVRQIVLDQRPRTVEALMFPNILVPEGRIDDTWLRLLADVVATGERPNRGPAIYPPFGAIMGTVPTKDAATVATWRYLQPLNPNPVPIVDGDAAGDGYVQSLLAQVPRPRTVLQWAAGQMIEHVVGWCIDVDSVTVLPEINISLARQYATTIALIAELQVNSNQGGLKSDYFAYEDIAAVLKRSPACVARVEELLQSIVQLMQAPGQPNARWSLDARSVPESDVYRFVP